MNIVNDDENDVLSRVVLRRAAMTTARTYADAAASAYRDAVRDAVATWKAAEGLSLRKAAARLDITEGALRDLLRAPGQARRAPKRRQPSQGQ